MADIFLSYKRENLAKVQPLVQALRASGLSLWWDQDIAPDAPWEATIERELAAAKLVIVAWSPAAVASENVKAEARAARTAGKLIQVFVEPCAPPLFFGERQGVDLSSWSGQASDPPLQTLLEAVRAVLAGRKPPEGVGYAAKKRSPWGVITAIALGVSAALGIIANLSTARDFVCGLGPVRGLCLAYGLIAPPADPDAEAAKARAALLAKIEGVWGLPARAEGEVRGLPSRPACTQVSNYSVSARGGEDFVLVRMGEYESTGRVVSVDVAAGAIFTRTLTPIAEAGAQGELRPEGDRLTSLDARGVATILVRCDGAL